MPYAPGTILRSTSDRRSYDAYRVIRLSDPGREQYEVEVHELRSDNGGLGREPIGHRRNRNRYDLDRYGYEPDPSDSEPREEVKMKIHNLIHNSPDVATPVSAVTMPDAALNTGVATASRRFARSTWSSSDEPEFELTSDESVLVEFSDGTLGVCSEGRLGAALASFDLQLVTS